MCENTQFRIQEEVWVTFAAPINEDAARKFFQLFSQLASGGCRRAHLLIQSVGGSVPDGVAIYGFLKSLPMEVFTYNCGQISSIAVLPYLAGSKRFISDHAAFLVHRSTFTFQTPASAAEIESRKRLIEFDDSRTKRILEDYFVSITEEERVLFRDGDWIFGASDALRIGIATEIGQFRMPKNCQVFPIG